MGMAERPPTPLMLLAMRDALSHGRVVSRTVNDSVWHNLRRRGLTEKDGTLTDDGLAIARTDAQNIMPCRKCSRPTQQIYTIPTGSEICQGCASRDAPAHPGRRETGVGSDVRYHGDYQ